MQLMASLCHRNGGLTACKHCSDGTYILLMQQIPYYVCPFAIICCNVISLPKLNICSSVIILIEIFLGFSESSWFMNVVDPSVKIISSYLNKDKSLLPYSALSNGTERSKVIQRDLWMQHICKVNNACSPRLWFS